MIVDAKQREDLALGRVGLCASNRYNGGMQKLAMVVLFMAALRAESAPSWNQDEPIPAGGRPNPYEYSDADFEKAVHAGRIHALVYPVEVTGAILPFEPVRRFLDEPSPSPIRSFLQSISRAFTQITSFYQAMNWLGLHEYPTNAGQTGSDIPLPQGMQPGSPMGLSLIQTPLGTGFTFSCAACHTGNLFGRPILGLTNRFPRANALFIRGKMVTDAVPSHFFAMALSATRDERKLYQRTRHNMFHVSSKQPEALGLDTSLAHVAMSLARRTRDEFATKDPQKPWDPDWEPLEWLPADSKPAVWWNVKYKNRWLSDGSVLSGNPVVTNLLWNELGRGTDLHDLQEWLSKNEQKVHELTTAVFATRAPRITEFFPVERLDLAAARRGQDLFIRNCAHCHGRYEKAWDQPGGEQLPLIEQFKTTKIIYHQKTPVMDVGTDAYRREGMKSLVRLNELRISKDNKVLVAQQQGYVPPPLEGIWARWPYFHNNSAPNLCAVLSPSHERPSKYYSGEALDRETDFDFVCNGYPVGEKTPPAWRETVHLYDTSRKGLSNRGHEMFQLTEPQRRDVIRFLQTL